MELFQSLGAEIEAKWLAKNYNEEHLPSIAAEALKRADIPSKVSAWDVIEWSLKQSELPQQRDLAGKFGEPPITIFSGPRFHIDVYFWFEGTTAIHQHSFCGAFQVLMGSSIHSWYEFETNKSINIFCEIGDLSLKLCEILEVGGVQEIWGGKRYIHSLFHLEQPSATIVVRTDRSPIDLPQFEFYKPNLAIDPFFEQATTIKKLQAMSALFRAKRPDAARLAVELIETSDFQTTFSILKQIRTMTQADHLSELFNLESPISRFAPFLESVTKKHGDVFKGVFEWIDVQDEIIKRRGYITDPEHRFFMALLLNVEGRERIFSLIKQRFPNSDPLEKVLDWTFDLAQTRVLGKETTNALGIPDFGESEMFVLEGLLHGKTDEEIKLSFAAENPTTETSACDAALAKIRESVLFRVLLIAS